MALPKREGGGVWRPGAGARNAAMNTSGAFQRKQTSIVVSDVGTTR